MHQAPVIALLLLPAILFGGEIVQLNNGYTLAIEQHVVEEDNIRLKMANGGWIVLPADAVTKINPGSTEPDQENLLPNSSGQGSVDIDSEVESLAMQLGLPTELIRAVIWAESGFQPNAVSSKGAIGLMQLMPATAFELGVNPHVPSENLRGGIRYLQQLLEQYDGDEDQIVKALAAYNAGPGRVSQYDGTPPFPETIGYVGKIIRRYLALTGQKRADQNTPHTRQQFTDTAPID